MKLKGFPKWGSKQSIAALIRGAAKRHNIKPEIIAAVIYQESKGDPYASRDEDDWYERNIAWRGRQDLSGYVPRGTPNLTTEKRARARSFGLMQILGETARSILRFKGNYLTELYDPEVNIELGCQLLSRLLERTKGDVAKALLRYNGGGNKRYPIDVLSHIETEAYKQVLIDE